MLVILPSKLRSFILDVTPPINKVKLHGGKFSLFLSPPAVNTNFSTVISCTASKSSFYILYSFAFLLSTSIIDTAIDHGYHRFPLGGSATTSCFSSEHHHSNNATRCPLLPRGRRESDLRWRSKHIRYFDLLHH